MRTETGKSDSELAKKLRIRWESVAGASGSIGGTFKRLSQNPNLLVFVELVCLFRYRIGSNYCQ